MLDRIRKYLILIGAAIAALVIAFAKGRRAADTDHEINEYVRAREAALKREAIDEDVDQSPDLVDRAERAGILRKD